MTSSNPQEPLTAPNPNRWCYFPIQHPKLHAMAKQQANCMWFPEEIDMETDVGQWDSQLDADTKNYLIHILAFFASVDGLVNQNLFDQFMQEIQVSECLAFYAYQAAVEQVHNETYSLFIDRLLSDDDKARAFNAIVEFPCIKKKSDWALQYCNKDMPLGKRLVAFALVEGLFFSASFAAICYLKTMRGLMPGLASANEFISRDEGMHCDFAITVYNDHIVHKLTAAEIHEMIASAVDTEKVFVRDSLPVSLIGMDCEKMQEYVEFVANRICTALQVPKLYENATMPFDWLHSISIGTKSNFFEKRDTNYSKFKKTTLTFDAEF